MAKGWQKMLGACGLLTPSSSTMQHGDDGDVRLQGIESMSYDDNRIKNGIAK
ncbi:hypothetical protein SCLCIDRAFT_1213455 [Scleroderma citrinum Foug A]|uniref:Uncharacterized protein n=1 Tax=Scleroderma citrinum Foug A TaxID=1036808 RepID=A0A0C2ZS37_9AGAM|nr:hypothetical protein SCLCIDRAFT_1213455 [Scleroderma citrinum Foug A]